MIKVGDKVMVYDRALVRGYSKGIVVSSVDGWCIVEKVRLLQSNVFDSILVHEKQCRKLRKKK